MSTQPRMQSLNNLQGDKFIVKLNYYSVILTFWDILRLTVYLLAAEQCVTPALLFKEKSEQLLFISNELIPYKSSRGHKVDGTKPNQIRQNSLNNIYTPYMAVVRINIFERRRAQDKQTSPGAAPDLSIPGSVFFPPRRWRLYAIKYTVLPVYSPPSQVNESIFTLVRKFQGRVLLSKHLIVPPPIGTII